MGRPTRYNKKISEALCARIMQGESLRSICEDEDMPDKSTVCRWLADQDKSEFRDQYAHAREVQAELMGDELLDIADDGANDYVERVKKNGDVEVLFDKEAVMRSRLRVDARKWLMSKLKPKKYGDKITQEVTGANGGPIETLHQGPNVPPDPPKTHEEWVNRKLERDGLVTTNGTANGRH